MTLAITHAFVSLKADGTDTSLLRPSNWNGGHVITMAANMLVGRGVGPGDAEEIPCSPAARAMLAAEDAAAILAALGISPPSTGDGKITLKTVADVGWVMMDDGTIGDASSNATRANADTSALFTLIYNNILDVSAPLTTSGGGATTRAALGTAATAYAAHCRIALPKQLGRAIAAAGAGASLTDRALGSIFGEEGHALTAGENGPHDHEVFLQDLGHLHGGSAGVTSTADLQFGPSSRTAPFNKNTDSAFSNIKIRSAAAGGGTENKTASQGTGAAHNTMQPSTFWHVMVKL